jgi:uncharacterized MAPEG superfamily protein
MSVPLWMLMAFCAWTLGLATFGIALTRYVLVRRGELRLSEIRAELPQGPETYRRLLRAHANCAENLPLFGAVALTAHVTGAVTSGMNSLSVAFFVMRVVQSAAHIASGRRVGVLVRFTAFAMQIVCLASMIGLLVQHGLR